MRSSLVNARAGSLPAHYPAAIARERLRALTALVPWAAVLSVIAAWIIVLSMRGIGNVAYKTVLFLGVQITAVALAASARILRAWLHQPHAIGALRYAATGPFMLVFLLGVAWGSTPVVLFESAPSDQRVVIACASVALIAAALSFTPVAGMTEAMALPIAFGCIVEMIRVQSVPMHWLVVGVATYVAFITVTSGRWRRLLDQNYLAQLDLEEQQGTLQMVMSELVTGKAVDGAFANVWETDEQGHVRTMTPHLLRAIGGDARAVIGHPLPGLFAGTHFNAAQDEDFDQLTRCVADAVSFRDLVLALRIGGEIRYWSFAGRPQFDPQNRFCGFRGLVSDVTDDVTARKRASHQARHDTLTGLPNRAAFHDRLRQALASLGRTGRTFALLSIDLDGFKSVNDRLGHHVGDQALNATAQRLSLALADEQTMLARFGGDEFLALTTAPNIEVFAERIVTALQAPIAIGDDVVQLGASVGIARAPDAGDTVELLLEAADLAMYRAKTQGGGRWRWFDPAYRQQVEQRRSLAQQLRAAVANDDITLAFQPIVDSNRLALRGVEALARWNCGDEGPISPDRFIRLAEEIGVIDVLGRQILDKACRAALLLPQELTISVNVSVGQLHAATFPDTLRGVLERTGLPPARLELEITENVFMDTAHANLGVLHAIEDLGVRLVLDDFGRGFSSLGFLKEFRFSSIKIDNGFVHDMMVDRRSAAIVQAVIVLAAGLGISMTAEGVETVEQLGMLRRYGCTFAQGYLFSRPIPQADLQALLSDMTPNTFGAAGRFVLPSDAEPILAPRWIV